MSFRARLYRRVSSWVATPVLRRIRGEDEAGSAAKERKPDARRVWLHAASAGELESLWTVILELAGSGHELALTVFSPSARKAASRLSEEARARGGRVVIEGYSPGEGNWLEALSGFQPETFVTAKYEAWPELWTSLSELRIPLVIVGAQDRASLRWARRICGWLGSEVPAMTLLLSDGGPERELQSLFPRARIHVTGDPRWDRVLARSQSGNVRARTLAGLCSTLPRPWGIIGSAWEQDLLRFRALFKDSKFRLAGTLWVVPHVVDADVVHGMLESLAEAGRPGALLSSSLKSSPPEGTRTLLVDEMGFLSELYAQADWAFVGGGFGSGVHSTIEPAIHAIPIACGPAGAERFPEISELRRTGQCTVVEDPRELGRWLERAERMDPESREKWKSDVSRRIGGTARVLSLLPVDSRT